MERAPHMRGPLRERDAGARSLRAVRQQVPVEGVVPVGGPEGESELPTTGRLAGSWPGRPKSCFAHLPYLREVPLVIIACLADGVISLVQLKDRRPPSGMLTSDRSTVNREKRVRYGTVKTSSKPALDIARRDAAFVPSTAIHAIATASPCFNS
jgi:hypothetical protein